MKASLVILYDIVILYPTYKPKIYYINRQVLFFILVYKMAFEFVISMFCVTLLKEYKVFVSTFMFNECIYVVWSPYTVWYVLGYIGRTREVNPLKPHVPITGCYGCSWLQWSSFFVCLPIVHFSGGGLGVWCLPPLSTIF